MVPIIRAPNDNIQTYCDVFLRNDPSSSAWEYRTRKYMCHAKSKPNWPKKTNVVKNLHTSSFRRTKSKLKYRVKGDTRSRATAADVITEAAK